MNSNRNLIVALIALWCYTRNCNINLANNTSILLILYALLTRGYLNGEQIAQAYSRSPRLSPCANNQQTFNPQTTFGAPFNTPNNTFPFGAQPFQTSQCQCPLF